VSTSLQDLAAEARHYYYTYRREWLLRNGLHPDRLPPEHSTSFDGGEDRYGRRHKGAWLGVAAFILEHDLDPQKLVQALFATAVGGDAPLPNMLKSRWALQAAQGYKRSERMAVEADVQAAREAARRYIVLNRRPGLPDHKAWRRAILQPEQRNPLVSYVLSLSCGQPDLADDFKHGALLEYLRHQGPYEDALGKELPHDFREEALRLKASMLAQAGVADD